MAAGRYGQGLRIMLFGTRLSSKEHLCNFILEKKSLDHSSTFQKPEPVEQRLWKGKLITVVAPSESQIGNVQKEELEHCVSLCRPGPNVLLLLVNPSDFTEKDRRTLKATLSLFGKDTFKQSMVIITHEGNETNFSLNKLIGECEGRQYSLAENNHQRLMENIEDIVKTNSSAFLSIKDEGAALKCDKSLPSLNLVLCKTRLAQKTSAAKAILGQTDLPSAFSSSQCVRNQGEVCGRWVSVVELPALYGKAQQDVLKESHTCITLCNPEGVHAFILVLPVGPLTDEDKGELQTIQDTFSSRVNNNTMILFTTDLDPEHPDVVKCLKKDRNMKKLIKRYGRKYIVIKSNDKKQFSAIIDFVKKMKQRCYTSEMLFEACLDKIQLQEKTLTSLQREPSILRSQTWSSGHKDKWTYECLRIVLIGRAGCGKSSSGNTILGRKEFDQNLSQKSITKSCKKSMGEVEGRPVAVVDTADFFDSSSCQEEVTIELLRCISLLAPGPHVFLVVVQIGERLTPEEKETLKLLKESFGKNSEKFTIILLTRGDMLQKQSIEDYLENDCDESFKELIRDCEGRYHVFDNSKTDNRGQVVELIRKIDTLVAKNGCFTNEMLQEAETAIQKQILIILQEKEEEFKREREKLEERHQREREEKERKIKEERAKTEKEIKENNAKIQEIERKLQQAQEEKLKEQERRKVLESSWAHHTSATTGSVYESIYESVDESEHIYEPVSDYYNTGQIPKKGKIITQRPLDKTMETLQQKWQEQDKKRQEEEEKLEYLYESSKEEFKKQLEEDEKTKEKEVLYEEKMDYVFKQELDKLIEKYEEIARQKAEELNEFKEEFRKEFKAQTKGHAKKEKNLLKALKEFTDRGNKSKRRKENIDMVKSVTKNKELRKMISKQSEEMKNATTRQQMINLEKKHDTELDELLLQLMDEINIY